MDKELENKARINFAEVLNHFDFATVYDVMNYLDWHWGGENYSPTQKQMFKMVEELFEITIKDFEDSDIFAASGGFLVRIYKSGKVEIQFVVEEAESYEEE